MEKRRIHTFLKIICAQGNIMTLNRVRTRLFDFLSSIAIHCTIRTSLLFNSLVLGIILLNVSKNKRHFSQGSHLLRPALATLTSTAPPIIPLNFRSTGANNKRILNRHQKHRCYYERNDNIINHSRYQLMSIIFFFRL